MKLSIKTNPVYDVIVDYSILESFDSHLRPFNKNQLFILCFSSNLDVQSKIILGESSYLTGNLKAAIITIEEGARFDGMCSMIKNQNDTTENKNTSILSSRLKPVNEKI